MIDVERSKPAPPSLAQEVRYNDEDVLRALHRDFFGKCYLCERLLSLGEIEVDHRRAQSEWKEGRFHWPNLFPACRYCNGRRGRAYPEAGLLCPGDGVEVRVVQRARTDREGLELECEFTSAEREDAAAVATAEELCRLHSIGGGTTGRSRFAARELLQAIHDHYLREVHPCEIRVRRARRRSESNADAERQLRAALSRRAPFTMLMRSLVDPSLVDLFD